MFHIYYPQSPSPAPPPTNFSYLSAPLELISTILNVLLFFDANNGIHFHLFLFTSSKVDCIIKEMPPQYKILYLVL